MRFVITPWDILTFIFVAVWLIIFVLATVTVVFEDAKNKWKKWRKKNGKRVSKQNRKSKTL